MAHTFMTTPQDNIYIAKCKAFLSQAKSCTDIQEKIKTFVQLASMFSIDAEGRMFVNRHSQLKLVLQERIIYFIDACETHSLHYYKFQLELSYDSLFKSAPNSTESIATPTDLPEIDYVFV